MLASAPETREELTSGTSYSPPPAFGRFRLLHQIGAGVLGPVFRTHDPDHERLVAVKAFTLDLTPEQASALAEELGRLAALGIDAPCVAAPVAAGIEEFVPYVAVPYVSGESLDAAIRQYGPAPAGDAMRLITHVAEALDAAAHAGVYHGSLHPRDIIVTPGETHVTGLGVAQALERVGLHGPVRRPYVAPEREGGDEWGAAADIYALGAIAYEVLTGRRALPGTDQPLPGLSDIRVHDPAALREIIESALDADPGRRPPRALDFAVGFAAALSETAAGAAHVERVPDRRPRKPRTKPAKLPGLDEPLAEAENVARARAGFEAPIVPVPSSPAPPAVTAVAGEVRYVPVSDPADAGESGPGLSHLPVSLPDVPLEAGPAPELVLPPSTDLPAARLATGLTPDHRLADELLSRPEAPGESVDAELAATLDRLSSDRDAGPASAAIGLDILGPGPSEQSAVEALATAGLEFDLAADTRVGQHMASDDMVLNLAGTSESAPAGRRAEEREPDLDEVEALLPPLEPEPTPPEVVPAPALEASPTPFAEAAAAPPAAEPPRPYVRAKGSERRRPPSRYSRFDTTQVEPDRPADEDDGVPRAFEPARPTPPAPPVPDFELLTRPAASRPPVVPVLIGVVAGLIVGLAGGYWLGSRGASPAATAPAGTITTVPPTATSRAPAAAAASPAPAATAAPADTPAPVAAAPAAPPAVERSPRAAGGAARGAIQVTASRQANVYLDGERSGLTPRSLKNVPLGSHVIRVTRPGYAPQEQTVVLTADEPSATLSFTLRSGSGTPPAGPAQAPAPKSVLTVFIESTPPGARIRIDGRDLAPTPLTVRQLRPGTHKLELRLPGYKTWSQTLTVAAGDARRITATLERDTAR